MSNQKLRVGIIGMGYYAATSLIPNLRATGRAEIVAAARRDPERLALAQRELSIPPPFTDWREMLEKVVKILSANYLLSLTAGRSSR